MIDSFTATSVFIVSRDVFLDSTILLRVERSSITFELRRFLVRSINTSKILPRFLSLARMAQSTGVRPFLPFAYAASGNSFRRNATTSSVDPCRNAR